MAVAVHACVSVGACMPHLSSWSASAVCCLLGVHSCLPACMTFSKLVVFLWWPSVEDLWGAWLLPHEPAPPACGCCCLCSAAVPSAAGRRLAHACTAAHLPAAADDPGGTAWPVAGAADVAGLGVAGPAAGQQAGPGGHAAAGTAPGEEGSTGSGAHNKLPLPRCHVNSGTSSSLFPVADGRSHKSCTCVRVSSGVLQVLLAAPLLWLLVSVACCWDSSLPRPVLAPDGSSLGSNGTRQKAA